MPETGHTAKIPVLEQRLGTLEGRVSQLAKETSEGFAHMERQISEGIKDLTKQMQESIRTQSSAKRGTIGILATAGLGAVGMAGTLLWTLLLSQINNAVNPMRENVTYISADLNALRSDYRDTAGKLTELREKFTAAESERRANEKELDVQFNADSQMRNIQFANTHRDMSILWNAASKEGATLPPYPSAGPWFMPNIATKGKSE